MDVVTASGRTTAHGGICEGKVLASEEEEEEGKERKRREKREKRQDRTGQADELVRSLSENATDEHAVQTESESERLPVASVTVSMPSLSPTSAIRPIGPRERRRTKPMRPVRPFTVPSPIAAYPIPSSVNYTLPEIPGDCVQQPTHTTPLPRREPYPDHVCIMLSCHPACLPEHLPTYMHTYCHII